MGINSLMFTLPCVLSQGRRGDVCGVQSHADRSGAPRAAADVRGVGVRPRGERTLLLASRLHASLLRVARLCRGLRLGVQTRPLPRGKEADAYENMPRPEEFVCLSAFREFQLRQESSGKLINLFVLKVR